MAVATRFIKPADLRSTVRGLAIMSVLFDKTQNCRFWTDAPSGCDLSVWRDGAGHACWFLFAPKGTVLLGFDRDSPMSPLAAKPADIQPWPGVYDELPKDLLELVRSKPFGEGFEIEEVTFLIWNTGKGLDWKKGKIEYPKRDTGDPDGSKFLLNRLREYFDHFEDEMEEEYEKTFDADALFVIFAGEPLGVEDLRKVKADLDVEAVRAGLKEIGVTV